MVIATTTAPVVAITELRIELQITDTGTTYQKYGIISLTIASGSSDNTAPTLAAIADLSFELGDTVNYAYTPADVDGGDTLTDTHTASSVLSACLSLDTVNDEIDITCSDYDLLGTYTVTVTITDDNSVGGAAGILSASQSFQLTLATPNTRPEFYDFSSPIELEAPQTAYSLELFYKDSESADTLVFLETVQDAGLAYLLTGVVPTGDSVVGTEK